MNRLGKWVHIRDGSGDPAKGTLYKDKDFGSGYKYKVIVEKATVKP
jgi:hypothetical protein